jgi:hypothetical protein
MNQGNLIQVMLTCELCTVSSLDVTYLDSSQIEEKTKLKYEGGILNHNAAQFWPAKFVHSLAQICHQQGTSLCDHSLIPNSLRSRYYYESNGHQRYSREG